MTTPIRIIAMSTLLAPAAGALGIESFFTGTDAGAGPHVKGFGVLTGGETHSFFAYTPTFSGGVRVAAGDVNGDGFNDIITGTGAGAPGGHVKVFNGQTGAELRSFIAYDTGFSGGVHVAAGDVDGDGRADIITGTGASTSHVKAFSGATGLEIRSFLAFGGFAGGVRVAAGDVNGDGRADIIAGTGASAAGGASQVTAFSGTDSSVLRNFNPYGSFAGGVFVAAGDVNGDGFADIVTGTDAGAAPHVKAFSGLNNSELRSFFAYTQSFTGGVRVASGDVDGDGLAEIITGTGAGVPAHVKMFDQNLAERHSLLPYGTFNGGVFVGAANMVPEPATLAALGLGLLCLRRRGKKRSAYSVER